MAEISGKKPLRFGGQRVRSFAPKSRGGCITCKKRRVKCGEEKPACQRCLQSKRHCEGYEESAKPWNLETTEISSAGWPSQTVSGKQPSTESGEVDRDPETGDLDINYTPVKCSKCGGSHNDASCSSWMASMSVRPRGSPYRQQREQHLFKFFVEVVAASVSRSNISAGYWLGSFLQVAFDMSSVRDCLLAISAAFQASSGPYFAMDSRPISLAAASSMAYEGRAMRALSRGSPSTAEVLNTSVAFWVTSMVLGDWGMSLQHLYYCLKIIKGLPDRSKLDQGQTRYQATLAAIGLGYFRITRGTCKKHGPGDFLNCEATCYTPEEKTLAQRVTDSLHHLREALPYFELCFELLRNRLEPHTHQSEIDTMLRKEIDEIRFLVSAWSDQDRLQIGDQEWSEALAEAPYTTSPFEQVLADLIRYTVNDQYTTGIVWQELELRTRVSIPHIVASTCRGSRIIIEDSLALLYYGGYREGSLRTKGHWNNKHVRALMDTVQ